LLGLLVDQGVAIPDKLGATGSSYGGVQALQLAYLKDRIRLPDGSFAPWVSPAGRPMKLTAAAPMLAWSDAISVMYPNGRLGAASPPGTKTSRDIVGMRLASFFDLVITGSRFLNLMAPLGADPTADLERWLTFTAKDLAGPAGRKIADDVYRYHSALAIPGKPAPLLLTQGWTDGAEPVGQSLAVYNTLRAKDPKAPVWMTLADFGHFRATNKRQTVNEIGGRGKRFLAHFLLGEGKLATPGTVTAYQTVCSNPQSDGEPFVASSFDELARGRVVVRLAGKAGTVTSDGGLMEIANAVDPVGSPLICKKPAPIKAEEDTVVLEATVKKPFTYLGRGVVTAKVRATGGSRPALFARLWQVVGKKQRLLDRAPYRLEPGQKSVRIELNGNAVRLGKGTRLRLQLLGRDAPTYEKPDQKYAVTLADVELELPTREKGGELKRRG
ncbi:MAG: hypothetical protein JHC95_22845, partial [Solirubrobacteraceae bacterium]|nr:hypothetical protein [Solirubrobacteraceae bacterium]